jgi:hypothetical protein
MNPVLTNLSEEIQRQATAFLPKAYLTGKLKAQRKFGILSRWDDRDKSNIILLLNRHAEELSKAMVTAEGRMAEGATLDSIIQAFIGRAGAWSWALFPAMALGMTSYVDENRDEIADKLPPPPKDQGQLARVPANDIGIIWHTSGRPNVCKVCDYLNGRWFDAHEAYALSAKVHPGCLCPPHFDVGVPSDALVGPIPDYKPGTAQDIYSNLNIAGLAQARHEANREELNRIRRQNTPRGRVAAEPMTRERLNKIRRQNIPRSKLPGEKALASL